MKYLKYFSFSLRIPRIYTSYPINPGSLENAANAINAFQVIPNNFSNAKKKKGRPKQEKRLTSIVEIVSTGSRI